MPFSAVSPSLLRWFATLKFKIVTMAVVTGVLSAVGTAQFILLTTQQDIERLLIRSNSDDTERTAALLSSKLEVLQDALKAVAHDMDLNLWDDQTAMTKYLVDKPGLETLFDSVFAARNTGDMLARVANGKATQVLPNVADRPYFQKSLQTDQPVVSEPLIGRAAKAPVVIISIPVVSGQGQVAGILAGSIALQSTSLFTDATRVNHQQGAHILVMNRSGTLLAHPDQTRVLGSVRDEPGMAAVFAKWHGSGSPIDTEGSTTLSEGYLVSMAGIPVSDWVVVRLTPQEVAFQPVQAAQRSALKAAVSVGLVAALLSGLLALYLTRPIYQLRKRAETLLTDASPHAENWPQGGGEVGQLSLAFQTLVQQRQQKQSETQALLEQLEAVLDHAEVGIVLTRNGHFELVSRHFCHIFRCEKQHAMDQPTRMIHASDEAYQALSERAQPAFMEHGAFDGEVELMRRSGQLFWAHMRGRAVMPGDRSKGTIWTIEDVTEAREQRERLTWTSSHDSLTGLANRPAFEVLLENATAHAASEPFCALFIDLDRFKQVNDTGGHAAGDALLRDVAHALESQVRKSDTVARLGGDEFAVLLSRCPLSQAQLIAEKIRSAVTSYQLTWEGAAYSVGASVGLVCVSAGYASAADVLRAADAACYTAKQRGRNCVAVYDGAVSADSSD